MDEKFEDVAKRVVNGMTTQHLERCFQDTRFVWSDTRLEPVMDMAEEALRRIVLEELAKRKE